MVEDIFGSTSQGVEEVAPPGDLGLAGALHHHIQELREVLNEGRNLGQEGVYSGNKP